MRKDAENRLIWRANRRRVDAEVLRDSILYISGELDLASGGRTIRKITQYDLGYEFDTVRRSVYVPAFRNSMLPLFEVFDFANPNLVTGGSKYEYSSDSGVVSDERSGCDSIVQ